MTGNTFRAWLTLACVSLMFFLITALTFSSLGVVLPAMVAELHWSWGAAGTGFSLLGVFTGLASLIPAVLIRRLGVRAALMLGAIVMAAGFVALARAQGLWLYFLGCSLAGLSFMTLATVPGTYLLSRVFARPSFAFGLYFTVGGLGGVAGPPLYFWVSALSGGYGGWRGYWIFAAIAVLVLGAVSAMLVDVTTNLEGTRDPDPAITSQSWDVKAALRTPQFAVLAAAYSVFLFVGITVNAVAVAHLMTHGIAPVVAGALMSLEAMLNSFARFLGGVAGRFVSAKIMLLAALALLIVGLLALGVAQGAPMMLVFAGGIGIGYGLTFFASTILLLEYFGRGPNLELFSTVNLISTIGAVGPAFAGFIFDRSGQFVPAFIILAVVVALVMLAVVLMRAPRMGEAPGNPAA